VYQFRSVHRSHRCGSRKSGVMEHSWFVLQADYRLGISLSPPCCNGSSKLFNIRLPADVDRRLRFCYRYADADPGTGLADLATQPFDQTSALDHLQATPIILFSLVGESSRTALNAATC